MRIRWTTLYVDDQDKALQFYTDKLGFQKKADFTNGSYRWLTVVSSEEPDGVELILESNANPAGRAYQEALRGRSQPAAQFLVMTCRPSMIDWPRRECSSPRRSRPQLVPSLPCWTTHVAT